MRCKLRVRATSKASIEPRQIAAQPLEVNTGGTRKS